jgi:hypothetical protein
MRYCPAAVAAAYTSTHGTEFLPSERHAASCGIIRHQIYRKDHFATRMARSLHPHYISVNGLGNSSIEEQQEIRKFQQDSLDDLFDAVRF